MHREPTGRKRLLGNRLEARAWRRLGWLCFGAQMLGCAVLPNAQGWSGVPVLLVYAAVTAALLGARRLFSPAFAFIFSFASAVNAAGWVFNIYEQAWWFDDVLHYLTPLGLIGALASATVRLGWISLHERVWRFVARAVILGLFVGLAWEASEAIFTTFAISDTLLDLAFDTLGAATAGWLVWRFGDAPRRRLAWRAARASGCAAG